MAPPLHTMLAAVVPGASYAVAHLAVTISGDMESIGVTVRLHDLVGDDLGLACVPAPIELGDIVATDDGEFRIVDVVLSPPGSPISALVKVAPVHLHVAAC